VLKFVVVLYRKPGHAREEFREYFTRAHAPLAEAIPGLRRYVQNFVVPDPTRPDPGWDAVIELWWQSREDMETAWATREGKAATADLDNFADLSRSTWSIVEERVSL
jgi:uncharacterized protein (TIGR02118 family)